MKPWINNELVQKLNRKNYLFKYYRDGITFFDNYNQYNKLISHGQ